MTDLEKRSFLGLIFFVLVLAVILFAGAGTFDYWQAWLFLVVWSAAMLALTLYVMKHDPELLRRRLSVGPIAEKEPAQKRIQGVLSVFTIALFLVPALDHRFGWSSVPVDDVIVGDILCALGFYIIYRVFKENPFASATVEVDDAQRVVSTGPYAAVRHPMYTGAIVLFLGTPPALGSWVGLWLVLPITLGIILRLLDEEKFLTTNLPGYAAYRDNVRYRLVPFIW
jgi:protein-S-isoprenylcysteine O-methyltransferase Ste14